MLLRHKLPLIGLCVCVWQDFDSTKNHGCATKKSICCGWEYALRKKYSVIIFEHCNFVCNTSSCVMRVSDLVYCLVLLHLVTHEMKWVFVTAVLSSLCLTRWSARDGLFVKMRRWWLRNSHAFWLRTNYLPIYSLKWDLSNSRNILGKVSRCGNIYILKKSIKIGYLNGQYAYIKSLAYFFLHCFSWSNGRTCL